MSCIGKWSFFPELDLGTLFFSYKDNKTSLKYHPQSLPLTLETPTASSVASPGLPTDFRCNRNTDDQWLTILYWLFASRLSGKWQTEREQRDTSKIVKLCTLSAMSKEVMEVLSWSLLQLGNNFYDRTWFFTFTGSVFVLNSNIFS